MNDDLWFWVKDLDLSAKSYDEFVDFFFARDVVPDDEQFDYFFRDVSGEQYEAIVFSSPARVVGYMTRMFSEFGRIASKHPLALVDQAVWAILGAGLNMPDLLWDESTALADRTACIRSMGDVFSNYVVALGPEPEESGFFMWWDLVLKSFWWQPRFDQAGSGTGEVGKLDADSRSLLDAMFETLQRILELPNQKARKSALHGFGHLHHPAGRDVVQDFIDKNGTGFSVGELKWIEECRDGTAL